MKISLLGGTGSFAEGLAIRWAKAGHEILIGSRKIEKAQEEVGKMLETAKTQGIDANIVGFENAEAAKIARLWLFACHLNIPSQL